MYYIRALLYDQHPTDSVERGSTMAVLITPQRKQVLETRLEELRKELLEERQEFANARNNDHETSVNAELADLAGRVGFKEGQIKEIEDILGNSVPVEPDCNCVGLGSKVTLSLMRGDEIFETITAVIDAVADGRGPLPVYSPESPMMKFIIGEKEGCIVEGFKTPTGKVFDIRVESVESAYDC